MKIHWPEKNFTLQLCKVRRSIRKRVHELRTEMFVANFGKSQPKRRSRCSEVRFLKVLDEAGQTQCCDNADDMSKALTLFFQDLFSDSDDGT